MLTRNAASAHPSGGNTMLIKKYSPPGIPESPGINPIAAGIKPSNDPHNINCMPHILRSSDEVVIYLRKNTITPANR